jgi:hypothetical protein
MNFFELVVSYYSKVNTGTAGTIICDTGIILYTLTKSGYESSFVFETE